MPARKPAAQSKVCLGLAPKIAHRVDANGDEADVPLESVQAGDHLRVRSGEKIPVDGVVTSGIERGGRVDDFR